MIAALGDFQIAVVARRERDAGGGQKIHERIRRGRHGGMDGIQHLLILMRAGDGQNAWMRAGDILRIGPQTAGDNHLAVLMQRLTNRLKTFRLGAVEKAAGVDNHRLCAGVIGADGIALRAQAGQNALAVDQSLGTAQRYHADGRLARARGFNPRFGREVRAEVGRILCHSAAIAEIAQMCRWQIAEPISRQWPRRRLQNPKALR